LNSQEILEYIDSEIARLQQAKVLLNGGAPASTKRGAAKPAPVAATSFEFGTDATPAPQKRRRLSAQARARIAAAQKLRWAKVRAAKK
jgi:hypothetical protein